MKLPCGLTVTQSEAQKILELVGLLVPYSTNAKNLRFEFLDALKTGKVVKNA